MLSKYSSRCSTFVPLQPNTATQVLSSKVSQNGNNAHDSVLENFLTTDRDLVNAVSELKKLFEEKPQIVLSAIDSRSMAIDNRTIAIDARTQEMMANLSVVQRTGNELHAGVDRLGVQMDRALGMSTSSQASLDEVHVKLDEINSNLQG
jgi:hypothetical protein